jgi:trans-aconitate 2-methyltransferase
MLASECDASMPDWNPELYNRFSRYRREPVEHIFVRLRVADDERIVDLGCGSGEHTIALARRGVRAAARGFDRSPAMIEAARAALAKEDADLRGRVSFEVGQLSEFRAHREFTLIFSNAAFHWIAEQRPLFRNCFDSLAPGGQIVVQMPANESETAKIEIARLAAEQPWAPMLHGLEHAFPEPPPEHYVRMLSEIGFDSIDCYHHTFHHPMSAPAKVIDWYRATGLRPFLARFPEDRHGEFLAVLLRRLEQAYGTTGPMTFKFRRLFIWARRPAG